MNTSELDISRLLQRHFPELSEKALQEEIVSVGRLYHFKAGEVIQDFGGYIKLVPLLLSGSIKVQREDDEGNELLLYFLEAGQTCSMSFSCCMMNKQSDIRTVAEEDVSMIGIPIQYVDEWMRKYQSWKNFVMRSYDQRMRDLIKTIDSIAFKKMDERLLEYLEQKVQVNTNPVLSTTHQSIAYDLNASREAISRLLKQLEKQGRVKLGRNKIELLA